MTMKPEASLLHLVDAAKRFPRLSPGREYTLAVAWREKADRSALLELVGSHLRLPMRIARGFAGYGLPLTDLVGEGNVGLMQAVERFDPRRGCRLSKYAVWWVHAAIYDYMVQFWSLVKIDSTNAERKLFFNLRRLKSRLQDVDQCDLRRETVTSIARQLNVPVAAVVEMNGRVSGHDNSLNAIRGADIRGEWLELVPDDRPNQESVMGDFEESRFRRDLLKAALQALNSREREILIERRLKHDPASLDELARSYGVSRERVRQIELRTVEKLRRSMVATTTGSVHQSRAKVFIRTDCAG
jgi:RNA polymerase sigma-32 factor